MVFTKALCKLSRANCINDLPFIQSIFFNTRNNICLLAFSAFFLIYPCVVLSNSFSASSRRTVYEIDNTPDVANNLYSIAATKFQVIFSVYQCCVSLIFFFYLYLNSYLTHIYYKNTEFLWLKGAYMKKFVRPAEQI